VSLKVFIAGCLPQDRGQIEGVVKKALGDRSESGLWNVSLVKMGDSWSISVDGPEPQFKSLSLTAAADRLQETITGVLNNHKPDGNPTSLSKVETAQERETAGDSRDRYECPECKRPFMVVYPAQPKDRETKAPVACPHCWQVTQVTVTESAAITEEYRAEVIPT
jgi:hypothetical protein